MAQTSRSAVLDSVTKRRALAAGSEHAQHLAPGCYLLYFRPRSGAAGTWGARFYDAASRRKARRRIGTADDTMPADGKLTLSHEQAKEAAMLWCQEEGQRAHLRATGEVVSTRPVTVGECLDAYLAKAEREGRPTESTAAYIRTRIKPQLGDIQVAKLTRKKVEDWLDALAASPRRRTGQKHSEEGEWGEEGPTKQQLQARRSTANRILTILKRALNLAAEGRAYSGPTPWRDVKALAQAGIARVRFLSSEEQARLVNVCPPDFRLLVLAALYTGSRFGPLTRLRARDVDLKAKAVWISKDKGRGDTSRWVHLDGEGLRWFKGLVAGKKPDELLLRRASAVRVTRKDGDPLRWMPHDQTAFMARACEAAKLEHLTFHELRHTYASMLVNAGVPLAFVAGQLGHANTRMVEKHYGHLAKSAIAEAITKLTPKRRLTAKPKVQPLAIKQRA